jgi:hypothetical protein
MRKVGRTEERSDDVPAPTAGASLRSIRPTRSTSDFRRGSPTGEATGLSPVQCGFESHPRHQFRKRRPIRLAAGCQVLSLEAGVRFSHGSIGLDLKHRDTEGTELIQAQPQWTPCLCVSNRRLRHRSPTEEASGLEPEC